MIRRLAEGESTRSVVVGAVISLPVLIVGGIVMHRVLGWPASPVHQHIRWRSNDLFVIIPALLHAAPIGMAAYVLVRRLEMPFLFAYFVAILVYALSLVPLFFIGHRVVSSPTVRSYLDDEIE